MGKNKCAEVNRREVAVSVAKDKMTKKMKIQEGGA